MKNDEEQVCGGNFVAISAIFHTQHFKHSLLYITNTPRMFSINKHTSYQQITTRATMRLLEQREVRLLACAYNNWIFINFLFFFYIYPKVNKYTELSKLSLIVYALFMSDMQIIRYSKLIKFQFRSFPCSSFARCYMLLRNQLDLTYK